MLGVLRKSAIIQVAFAALLFILLFIAVGRYSDTTIFDFAGGVVDTSHGSSVVGNGWNGVEHAIFRYDAGHYMHLANQGYNRQEAAFFPLFPLAVRAITHLMHASPQTGVLLTSWIFAIAAAVVFYKWIEFELRNRKSKVSPWMALFLLAIFPTSFYMAAGYSESLFFFLSVSSLYAYRSKHYLLAGIFLAIATAARVQAGALAVFYLVDYLFEQPWRHHWPDKIKLLPVVLSPLGIGSYMIFLWRAYHNPFEFIVAQHNWGRLSGNFVHNMLSSVTPPYLFWYVPVMLIFLWLIYKQLGKSWLIYSLVYLLIPLSSGRLDSLNRYLLALPPVFLALSLYEPVSPKHLKYIYIVSSGFILAWNVLLYTNNYWVG